MKNDESLPMPPGGATRMDVSSIRHSGFFIPLWLWVAAAFLLLVTAWAAMFIAARSAKVESVPLATKEARP